MDSAAAGYGAVAVAILTFGTWGVPLKLKRVRNSGVDAGVLQAYACITVSLSSFIVLAFEPFIFSPWGILGALLWILSQLAAVNGFSMISIAVAAPLVAGITITVAFVWGVAFLGAEVKSMVGCLLGILVIFIGIIGVAASSTTLPDRLWAAVCGRRRAAVAADKGLILEGDDDDDDEDGGGDNQRESNGNDANGEQRTYRRNPSEVAMLPINGQAHRLDDAESDDDQGGSSSAAKALATPAAPAAASAGMPNPAAARRQALLGYVFCIVCAIFNGSVMVPSVLFAREVEAAVAAGQYADRAPTGLAYLPSMGIGIFIVTLPVHTLYFLARRKRPQFMPRVAALPGMATGVLWSIGNACAIIAGEALGNAIGYPLTQTALLVAQIWSVVYFKEIRGFAIVVLAVSALVLLGGAAMLAVFG